MEPTLDQIAEATKSILDKHLVPSIEETKKSISDFGVKVGEIENQVKTIMEQQEAMKKGASVPGSEDTVKQKFDFSKAIQCVLAKKKLAGCEHEHEIMTLACENRAKAHSQGIPTDGGYVVPPEHSKDIIDLAYAKSIMGNLDVLRITPTGMPIFIPKITEGLKGFWVGENEEITASQMKFDQIQMNPKMLAALAVSSRRVDYASDPSISNIIRDDITRALRIELDRALIFGSGTTNEPLGLFSNTNIPRIFATEEKAFDWQTASSMIGVLEDADTLEGSTAFVSNPSVFRHARKQAIAPFNGATEKFPLWNPAIITNQQLAEYYGHPLVASNIVPRDRSVSGDPGGTLSLVVFGNWRDLVFANWWGITLEATTVGAGTFEKHQSAVKAVIDCDFGVRREKSFVIMPFVTTDTPAVVTP